MLRDLVNLIFPRKCPGCGETLLGKEGEVCLNCVTEIPQTGFHQSPQDNELYYRLAGRVEMDGALAMYYFDKHGKMKRIIQALKYKNRPGLGSYLGEEWGAVLAGAKVLSENQGDSEEEGFSGGKDLSGVKVSSGGEELSGTQLLSEIDRFVPVPLHRKRQRERGYNQAEQIAIGLGKAMGIPVDTRSLVRIGATKTQTRMGKEERWNNVKGVFELKRPLEGHIGLVDDVVTTGATLESCLRALQAGGSDNLRVTVFSLCMARI